LKRDEENTMTTTTSAKTVIKQALASEVLARISEEGYGPGAWHGSDLKAALADVSPELAFWRPSPGRHSIAEIALHHAYCARSVRAQLAGTTPEPFVMQGEDWFPLGDRSPLAWPEITAAVDAEQRALATAIADVGAGRTQSSVAAAERFDLVLGITCHAVYHAGQIQLIKRLHAQ
jgi:hypothetical protein